MTTPDTTTAEAPTEENTAAAATTVVETEPAAPEATSEAKAEAEAPAPETTTAAPAAVEPAPDAAAPVAETATAVAATEVAAPIAVATPAGAAEEEDPQTAVFSLVTFFLAALPVIGVILNAIAVARAGKEGFDLWLARWGLALAIVETVGALLLVGLGYYFGLLTAGAI
jgi:hypothetical protein